MNNVGKFVISLDLELYWGVFDVIPFKKYKEHILGVREVIPMLLNKFDRNNIKVTWGIVGFLFFSNKEELLSSLPNVQPKYKNVALSSYNQMKAVGENETIDPFHFGSDIINQINMYPNHEIATHTFSHYYCLADGQNAHAFEEDLLKAIEIAKKRGNQIETIIFPRNQFNRKYLSICKNNGLTAYRGNENHWLYKASYKEGVIKRGIRLMDSYINISGHHIYSLDELKDDNGLINIPSSSFLRPYVRKAKQLESLKLNRIKASMSKAAKEGKVYHLWWHPHNFGVDIQENMQMLDSIIEHYHKLNGQYGMKSITMQGIQEKLNH